jgi:PhzF family phenazine biosynthesis protein
MPDTDGLKMNPLRMFQIDAFTDEVFRGNPAAVVPLDEWLSDAQMQSIAAENNLAETAFFVPQGSGYHLRWFTPAQEVPLCGHATLASAFVVLRVLEPTRESVEFYTRSGTLTVRRAGPLLAMEFPRYDPIPCEAPPLLMEGLGICPQEVLRTAPDTNYYAVFDTEAQVRAIAPDFRLLARLHPLGVAVTAAGEASDFVSRYFAPSFGIPEDPVTGSTHCALIPYWARRLGKPTLHARQASARSGDLFCEDKDDQVIISGQAVKYLEGWLFL